MSSDVGSKRWRPGKTGLDQGVYAGNTSRGGGPKLVLLGFPSPGVRDQEAPAIMLQGMDRPYLVYSTSLLPPWVNTELVALQRGGGGGAGWPRGCCLLQMAHNSELGVSGHAFSNRGKGQGWRRRVEGAGRKIISLYGRRD